MDRAAAIEARLRRLDTAGCRALVLDLWAARGFETERAGETVLATRDGRSVTLLPVGADRSGDRPPASTRRVDMVVAPGGGPPADRLAARHDARRLDAGDLRRALRYAVDPETAATLCRRHLGAPPDDLRAPRRDRLAARIPRPSGVVPSVGGLFLLTALLAGSVLAGAGVDVGVGFGGPPTVTESASPGTTDARGFRTATGGTVDGAAAVPGVHSNGSVAVSTLARAHGEFLRTRSYVLRIDVHRPRDMGPKSPQVRQSTEAAVGDDGRFTLRTVLVGEAGRRPLYEVYHDGAAWYVRERTAGGTSYRRLVGPDAPASAPGRDPLDFPRTAVARYLSTPSVEVTGRAEVDGRQYYRIEAEGRPTDPWFGKVRNYSAVAVVDRRGFVRTLDARYLIIRGHRAYRIRVEIRYPRLGGVTVERPPWVTRRFVANATATPPG